MEHVIETYGQPLFARARQLDQAKLESAKAEFRKMEEAGIIRHSDSPNVVADNLSRPSPPSPCHPPFAHPPGGQVSEVSEVLEVLEVSEVSEVTDSSLPSPFPTSA